MPICKMCKESFPNRFVIDGKLRQLCNRKYCLKCSPFGEHNTRKKEKKIDEQRVCPKCKISKSVMNYYARRGVTGKSVYCKDCTSNQTVERQQEFKKKCVAYKGGKCSLCGYNKYVGSLEFHHIDKNEKDFCISNSKLTTFNDQIKSEIDKCILLCSNCHREEHAKLKGLL